MLEGTRYQAAIQDFRDARRRAALNEMLAKFSGNSAELLDYEDIRRKLKATGQIPAKGVQDIPLSAIVGSVGRYRDYTRDFMPKSDSDEYRWAKVKTAVSGAIGVPPIDVYKIGDAYFVIDGNHRVSVARQMAQPTISAYVTEVKTRVPLTPDDDPEKIILKARYADFLDKTELDTLRPNADLTMNVSGQYRVLLEHIDAHQYFMGLDMSRDITYEEAVAHWYDAVYLPLIAYLHQRGVPRHFTGLTDTDLYVLLSEYRTELEHDLGWDVQADKAVSSLLEDKTASPLKTVSKASSKLLSAITPDELEAGPPAGDWRMNRPDDGKLFTDILVAVRGQEADWRAVEHAIRIGEHEGSRLLGMHVTESASWLESEALTNLQTAVTNRFSESTLTGQFVAVVHESPTQAILKRASWVDLLVVTLTDPPKDQVLSKLRSGLFALAQRSPCPVLMVPYGTDSKMQRALLAYDGSKKADEALFVACHLHVHWQVQLTVVAVETEFTRRDSLEKARAYLDAHQAKEVVFRYETGKVSDVLLAVSADMHSDLLIIGGFGGALMIKMVLGSTVDAMLRQFPHPILICR